MLNHGTVRASGGTLVTGIIDGQSGAITIDPGASLDLSGAGGDSARVRRARHSVLSGDQYPDGARTCVPFLDVTVIGWKRPSAGRVGAYART